MFNMLEALSCWGNGFGVGQTTRCDHRGIVDCGHLSCQQGLRLASLGLMPCTTESMKFNSSFVATFPNGVLAEGVGFEYPSFSLGISIFRESTHVPTHDQKS